MCPASSRFSHSYPNLAQSQDKGDNVKITAPALPAWEQINPDTKGHKQHISEEPDCQLV